MTVDQRVGAGRHGSCRRATARTGRRTPRTRRSPGRCRICLEAVAPLAAVTLLGAVVGCNGTPRGWSSCGGARDTSRGMTLWLMMAAGFMVGVVAAHAELVRRNCCLPVGVGLW